MIKIKNSTLGWVICSLAALFYCYEYLLRIAPSFMAPELMQAFGANATQFGILSAFFYFVYTPMQMVVGLLLDLYGPRRILTIAIITCAFGSYLFSSANILLVAAIGRALIGFGGAFAFVCILKLASTWLPQRFFALFVGLATMLGMIGAIIQVTIFSSFVQTIGWQKTINIGTIIGIILIPLILLIIRDKPHEANSVKSKPQYRETFKGFLNILKKPQMWLNGLIAGIMFLSLSLFAELWGIPFLSTVYKLSPHDASLACSMVYVGWLIGSPLIGFISDVTRSRRIPILFGCLGAAVLISTVIYLPEMNTKLLYLVLFLFGTCSSFQVLCFAISSENSPTHLVATASSFTNFLIMLGGFVFQPLIGALLDASWAGETLNNIRIYSSYSYQLAFSLLPVGFLLGFVLSFWLNETGKKNDKSQK
jgi:sugar phosphate permease